LNPLPDCLIIDRFRKLLSQYQIKKAYMMVRDMRQSDSPRVLAIYASGMETRQATFETKVPCWEEWDLRHLKHSRLVYEADGVVLGWAALSRVSERKVYAGVAEASIYVDTACLGRGIGSALMEKLIDSSESNGIWTLSSSVFPENKATIRLHEKYGFRIAGRRERIAMLGSEWRDTLLMERRSCKTGI
jgi:L-amino acid N-acyltransferase YncA